MVAGSRRVFGLVVRALSPSLDCKWQAFINRNDVVPETPGLLA